MTGIEGDPWEQCPACGALLGPEAERCGSCGTALSAPPADAAGVLMVQDLVPVFSGSRASVLALQAALACEGQASVIPDLHVRTMADPFAIGGNVLGFDLLAARDQAPAIEAAIAKLRCLPPPAASASQPGSDLHSPREAVRIATRLVRDWWNRQSAPRQMYLRATWILGSSLAFVLLVAKIWVLVETWSRPRG